MPAAPGRAARFAGVLVAYGFPLALILVLAAPRMYLPLDGDQTVFMMGAEAMRAGGALYVDFWDTKQPGIFLFYRAASAVYGATARGLHLFELIWHLALAIWMIHALRRRLELRGLASFAPVLAIGGYYCVASPPELTQVEALVSLPLFACAALAAATPASVRGLRLAWFGSGVAAGIAVLFKLLLAPVAVAMWVIASLAPGRDASPGAIVRDRWMPALGGTALVLFVTVAAFAAAGALEPLMWTTFVYPFEAFGSSMVSDPGRLRSSVRWWLLAFGLLVPFALLFRLRASGARERFFLVVAAWLVAAALVILIQKYSWWRYHFVLLIVPGAILAVRGIEGLALTLRERRWLPAPRVGAALLAVVALAPALRVRAADPTASPSPIHSRAARAEWERSMFPAIGRIWNDTAFLRAPGAPPGPIYVFGDPRVYTYAGRGQAIAINGWSWESYAARQWTALPAALAEARPAFIAAEPFYRDLVIQRSPATWNWIEANYAVLHEGRDRTWYVRQDAPAP